MEKHRRGRTAAAVAVLLGCISTLMTWAPLEPAGAGTLTTVNACLSSVTSGYYNVAITTEGAAAVIAPTRIDLTDLRLDVALPETVYLDLYRLGYLSPGSNFVGVTAGVTVAATATAEGQQTLSITTSLGVTVTDPDGIRGNGDETATASSIAVLLPTTSWTPTGGTIQLSQTAATVATSHFFGTATSTLTCGPGSTPDGTSVVPAVAEPFEVVVPPTAPTCSDTSVLGGPQSTIVVDLALLCADANDDLDFSTATVITGPTAGTVSLDPAGTLTYTNVDPNIGAELIELTVADGWGLVSETFRVTVLVQPLRFIEQSGSQVTLSEATIDGAVQVSSGELGAITVTNLPNSGVGFTVSAYASDLGAPGTPVAGVDVDGDGSDDVLFPTCTDDAQLARMCIPAANLGWAPRASVLDAPAGVPIVHPGLSSATNAQEWLELLTAGTPGTGLGQPQELCTADAVSSTGTFLCEAELFLGLPASAGAGTYRGLIVVTVI